MLPEKIQNLAQPYTVYWGNIHNITIYTSERANQKLSSGNWTKFSGSFWLVELGLFAAFLRMCIFDMFKKKLTQILLHTKLPV